LAVASESHVDVALQFIDIERVGRLAELEHHKVGDVDNVVDRTNTDALDFRPQPLWTRADMDSLDLARGKKRTFARRGNCYAGSPDRNSHVVSRRSQFRAGEGCDFARETEMT